MLANPWMAWWLACWQPMLTLSGMRPDSAMTMLRMAQHNELALQDAAKKALGTWQAMTRGAA